MHSKKPLLLKQHRLITKPNSKVQLGLPKMTGIFQAVEFQGNELHVFRNTPRPLMMGPTDCLATLGNYKSTLLTSQESEDLSI
jgi:hypothetical protein